MFDRKYYFGLFLLNLFSRLLFKVSCDTYYIENQKTARLEKTSFYPSEKSQSDFSRLTSEKHYNHIIKGYTLIKIGFRSLRTLHLLHLYLENKEDGLVTSSLAHPFFFQITLLPLFFLRSLATCTHHRKPQ